MTPKDRERLRRMLALLGSDQGGEVAVAGRAITMLLAKYGHRPEDLEPPSHPPARAPDPAFRPMVWPAPMRANNPSPPRPAPRRTWRAPRDVTDDAWREEGDATWHPKKKG